MAKIGLGTEILTGTNTFTGGTTISQGKTDSRQRIGPRSRQRHHNGGVLDAGNGIHTINVNGTYTQQEGSILSLTITSAAVHDNLVVTGAATWEVRFGSTWTQPSTPPSIRPST